MSQLFKISPFRTGKRINHSFFPLLLLRVCVVSSPFLGIHRQQMVRPLLNLNRYDVMRLCANWHLPLYPDVTNERLQFLRNRIRKQLLPVMRCVFNPRFEKSAFQCAELLLTEQIITEMTRSKLHRAGGVRSRWTEVPPHLKRCEGPLGSCEGPLNSGPLTPFFEE